MLLERIQLKNLLSFGPEAEEIELRPLNVLIGPNGSGKSNFIEAIGLLQAAPTDLSAPIRVGGGDWIWQGEDKADSGRVEVVLVLPDRQPPLRYSVEFAQHPGQFAVINEWLEFTAAAPHDPHPHVETDSTSSNALFPTRDWESARKLWPGDLPRQARYEQDTSMSILSQVKDSEDYPEAGRLAEHLASIRLYRAWTFGSGNVVRARQDTGHPNKNLAEDHANLGLVLNRLSRDLDVRKQIVEALRRLYEDVSDFYVNIELNTVQVFVQETRNIALPAARLSDGTIRYLSLLAVLCDPDPPPLVCIEEPELGLHPDILPGLAALLLEASERCQLVVTTHSEVLVDALTEQPECVVVCEKEDGQTKLKRLNQSELEHWLDKYRLGDLWSSGQIGGNRW